MRTLHMLSALRCWIWLVCLLAGMNTVTAQAENTAGTKADDAAYVDAEAPVATVEVDGVALLRVRGTSSFPPEARALAITKRIEALAADTKVPADTITVVETDEGSAIVAGGHRLMVVLDADATLESLDRHTLALGAVASIRHAVVEYRNTRSRTNMFRSSGLALAATILFALIIVATGRLMRRLSSWLEQRYQKRITALTIQSYPLVRAESVWRLMRHALDVVRAAVFVIVSFAYLQFVLGLFPWTRGTAYRLLEYVLDPLARMGRELANTIPDFIVLALIFIGFRYQIKLLRLLFAAIARGELTFEGFEREWAIPSYKLLRTASIAFAIVIAYPYVPGSNTDAFKGISIFFGLLVSLSSSSAIANIIAGYQLTYRRAFKIGDMVTIGNHLGRVLELRLQATHLSTVWNEEVIIPNSTILSSDVVNYSTFARDKGLILHTTVGIGYETPWRQVEAMLKMAAERTAGINQEPPPFIRQRAQALGDFAVTYELNAYCDSPQSMGELYTALHRNILDIFNEYGIQIMTPAYEGDPSEPKVVPKDAWFTAPAKREPDAK